MLKSGFVSLARVVSLCALLTLSAGTGFAQAVNNAGASGQVVDPLVPLLWAPP
jgi:hypothetical protein